MGNNICQNCSTTTVPLLVFYQICAGTTTTSRLPTQEGQNAMATRSDITRYGYWFCYGNLKTKKGYLVSELASSRLTLTLESLTLVSPVFQAKSWTFSRAQRRKLPRAGQNKHASMCVQMLPFRGVTRQWSFCGLQFFPFVFSFFQHVSRKTAEQEPDPSVFIRPIREETTRPLTNQSAGNVLTNRNKGGEESRGTAPTCNTSVTWSTEAVELAVRLIC